MVYEVWMEGYSATGQSAKHSYIGKAEAGTFKEACKIAMEEWLMEFYHGDKEKALDDYNRYYDEERKSFWGCRLFDNKADAARSFG